MMSIFDEKPGSPMEELREEGAFNKPFDLPVVEFKAAPLPREKKKKLRDLVVWATAVSRHEVRLRWQAEHERDEARRERDEAKRRCTGLEDERRKMGGKLGLAEAQVKELREMLAEANRRLDSIGQPEVGVGSVPAPSLGYEAFDRSRLVAPLDPKDGP